MSGPDEKGRDPSPDDASGTGDGGPSQNTPPRPGGSTPRWRQIEMLQERRALREMLDNIDDVEFEEEVFGNEQARAAYFLPSHDSDDAPDDEEDDGFDDDLDDDLEDDDGDDLDEDELLGD